MSLRFGVAGILIDSFDLLTRLLSAARAPENALQLTGESIHEFARVAFANRSDEYLDDMLAAKP
jgi:hypothetical protein